LNRWKGSPPRYENPVDCVRSRPIRVYRKSNPDAANDAPIDVADLIDKRVLRSTLDQSFGSINAVNLKKAHALLESGKSPGKIVLDGW
jgi:NADPH:quinone reductase-like Zn-dependent oxidoreductase